MNGRICPLCAQTGKKKNLRRMDASNRHKDAKLGKSRKYRCKHCHTIYEVL